MKRGKNTIRCRNCEKITVPFVMKIDDRESREVCPECRFIISVIYHSADGKFSLEV